MYRLCDLLSVKATLGLELHEAYNAGDKEALKLIAQKTIPQAIKKLDKFIETYRVQWFKENKSFGFESNGIRFGGVRERMLETARIINDYLDGKLEKIDELERERRAVSSAFEAGAPARCNSYRTIATSSIL